MSDFFTNLKHKLLVKTEPQLDERILHLVRTRASHSRQSKRSYWWGAAGLAAAALVVVLVTQRQTGSGDMMWQESPEMLTHLHEVEFFLESESLTEEDWAELEVAT